MTNIEKRLIEHGAWLDRTACVTTPPDPTPRRRPMLTLVAVALLVGCVIGIGVLQERRSGRETIAGTEPTSSPSATNRLPTDPDPITKPTATVGVTAPKALGDPGQATDLVADRSSAAALEIELMRTEPRTFGGVQADEPNGVVQVHYLASVGLDVALEKLRNHLSAVSTGGQPSAVSYPALRVELIASNKTYADYTALTQTVTSTDWTTDASKRVNAISSDYLHQTLRVGIQNLEQADVDRAMHQFGGDVMLYNSSPASG